MSHLKSALALSAALLLAGCGLNEDGHYALSSTRNSESVAVPVDPNSVQLVAGAPRAIFTPIRELKVSLNKLTLFHATPTENDVRAALQAEAARIGANAVINVEISGPQISPISFGVRTGTGLAVRF